MPLPHRRRAALLALLPVAIAGSLVAAPAQAAVTADDAFSVWAGSERTLDVLGNDVGSSMVVCGVDVPSDAEGVLYAAPDDASSDGAVYIETRPGYLFDVTFSYDVCENGSTTPTGSADVTLQVTPLQQLAVSKPKRQRGRLTVVNRNDVAVFVTWGKPDERAPQGRRSVPPNRSVSIKVDTRRIFWLGYRPDGDGFGPAGDGTVSDIRLTQRR